MLRKRRRLLLATGLVVVVGSLAARAPADPGYTALYPETVPGPGLGHLATGHGQAGGAAFTLSQARVTYGAFRSLAVRRVRFGRNAVRLAGVGLVHGRRVPFVAVGVHNALPGVDVFRIAWNRGASFGGVVTSGLLFVR